jgi:hypothetical protein
MSSNLTKNFREIKSRFDELDKNIVRAIERKENLEITSLKQLIDTKDAKMMELSVMLAQ